MAEQGLQARRTLARQPPPKGIYASKYDPELGAAICRRAAAGESLRSICADPALPTMKTLWNWARAHPEFAAMKAHALEAARMRRLSGQATGARPNAPSVPAPAGADAGPPPPEGEDRGRRRRAWNEGLDGYFLDHMIAWRIIAELETGRSLAAVCREAWAPSQGTVFNWLKRYPELARVYHEAKEIAGEALVEEAWEAAPWLGTEHASALAQRRAVRAAQRRASQLVSRRHAPPKPGQTLVVEVTAPGQGPGEGRVVYRATHCPPRAGGSSC